MTGARTESRATSIRELNDPSARRWPDRPTASSSFPNEPSLKQRSIAVSSVGSSLARPLTENQFACVRTLTRLTESVLVGIYQSAKEKRLIRVGLAATVPGSSRRSS